MQVSISRILLAGVFILLFTSDKTLSQSPTTAAEVWPKLSATFDLRPKTRLQLFGGSQDGGDFQWSGGAIVSYRMRRLVKVLGTDIDDENEHLLVLGAGYEYLRTIESDKTKSENRIIAQGTGRYGPGTGVRVTDRNRLEFRWVNGVYNFRYRNKVTVDRALRLNGFRFTPYVSGELFWDRNHHSWNENEYSFGLQLPYKRLLMLDTFYLHENCTTCNQQHTNVLGLTLNLYFKKK